MSARAFLRVRDAPTGPFDSVIAVKCTHATCTAHNAPDTLFVRMETGMHTQKNVYKQI